jgi:uncharacterized protein YbcI
LSAEEPITTSGHLNQSIANAVVRAHRRTAGRGPTKAQAFYRGNVVVVLLQDPLTVIEHHLIANGRQDAVRATRHQFEQAMQAQLVDSVQTLTGCGVDAAMSAMHIDPDLVAELFVLDRPVPGQELPRASREDRPRSDP